VPAWPAWRKDSGEKSKKPAARLASSSFVIPRSQAARGTDMTFIALLRKGDLALALSKALFLRFAGFVVAARTTHALHIKR
jgi:hypothetical protein